MSPGGLGASLFHEGTTVVRLYNYSGWEMITNFDSEDLFTGFVYHYAVRRTNGFLYF